MDNTNINIDYTNQEYKNLCVECGVDMGYCNPRQYCGKTYCVNEKYEINETNTETNTQTNTDEPPSKKIKITNK